MKIIAYQTLEDRDNPDDVEINGPFPSKHKSSWLGIGYYFWDSHIELAHWWGEVGYKNNYLICSASLVIDNSCWDLHNNAEHRIEFKHVCEEIVLKKISTHKKLLVNEVIEYLKKYVGFNYLAIRALSVNAINGLSDKYILRYKFKNESCAYLDIIPPVQICLLKQNALSLQNFRVIYPDYYCGQYA